LGAEFTQVYAVEYGSGVAPAENAESLAESNKAAGRDSPPPEQRTAGGRR
jgi:hypothetical protein